jgi:hypothetical protein
LADGPLSLSSLDGNKTYVFPFLPKCCGGMISSLVIGYTLHVSIVCGLEEAEFSNSDDELITDSPPRDFTRVCDLHDEYRACSVRERVETVNLAIVGQP